MVTGVLDTNAYIIGENQSRDVHLQGIFPVNSLINHSCSANTMCFARDSSSFTCRAVTDIKKGEELTTNYLHYQYHFFGLFYRQEELFKNWFFKCGCNRCREFTESDALVCEECEQGRIKPLNMNPGAEWVCSTCNASQTYEDVMMVITNWKNIIDQTSKNDIKVLMELLQNTSKVFGEKHYHILEVKRRIIENIGDLKGNNYEDLGEDWLEKKVEFCRDHLEIQRVIAPGLSEYRAYMSAHIAEPLYWLTKKRYISKKCSLEELNQTMEEIAQHLMLVIQIWGPYCNKSRERLKAENAMAMLEMVNNLYLHKNIKI